MATCNIAIQENFSGGNEFEQAVDKTQVLIVLSDNGLEEIPFVAEENRDEKCNTRIKGNENLQKSAIEETQTNRELTRTRHKSLPAKFININEHDKQTEPKDYLQVPSLVSANQTDDHLSRRASAHSLGSRSSYSSFGIYSEPESPMSLNSPSPSNASPNSVDFHRKFSFTQPQNSEELDIDCYVLSICQGISKSADPINEKHNDNEFTRSFEFTDSKSPSAIKSRTSKRKKSLLERLGNSMSERSLLGRRLGKTLSNSSADHNGKDHHSENTIVFPKTRRSSTKQRFRIMPARTGQADGISFESIDKPGCFLRCKGKFLEPEREGSDSFFNKDSTFVPLPDMWFKEFTAFESVGKPSYFIRLNQSEELVLDRYDGTTTFKEDASFALKKRPCTTCLQVGVKGWVRMNFGGYSLAKVVTINDHIEVESDGGKVIKIPKSSQEFLIPDVVPRADELTIGARVICQWLNRDYLYPGIITGKLSNGYKIQFDDGDNGVCQSHQIRLIRCHVFQDHSCKLQNLERLAIKDQPSTAIAQVQGNDGDSKSIRQASTKRHGKLWSLDAKDDKMHITKEPVCHIDSVSSTESQASSTAHIDTSSVTKKQFRVAMTTLQTPLFETETMSQDSGYHGYQRQKNSDKIYRRSLLRTIPHWKSAEEHIVNQL